MVLLPPGQKARTAAELRILMDRFDGLFADKCMPVLDDFALRAGDVVIATYPKCGTTWMQQIVHGLRSGGSMDFEEISLVVPWIESAALVGIDLHADQVAAPRAFKSHLPWSSLPRGGRNIFITRDPADVLVSYYHFRTGIYYEAGDIDITDFANEFFLRESWGNRYWDHLRGWWEVRERDDVLFLCFEDMKDDLRPIVARVAEFCGIAADDELIDLATEQAGFAFMSAHGNQFDDGPTTRAFIQELGFPPTNTTKVRAGRVGDGRREVPEPLVAVLDEIWRTEIAGPLGFASYGELRAALAS
ncbi:MAG: sulfotransferase domain-containing protein [Myxococcota bacterium]